jgi:hypothetical protein
MTLITVSYYGKACGKAVLQILRKVAVLAWLKVLIMFDYHTYIYKRKTIPVRRNCR